MPLMQRNHTQGVIPHGSQALIPSYRFDCSGNITKWLVSITSSPLAVESSEIELQVWRPVNNTGLCFNKVGGNIFTVSAMVQVANFTPTEQIKFQPGDVVGFRLLSPSQVQSPVTENSGKGDRNQDQDEREESSDDKREENDDDEEGDDDDDDDDDGVVILSEVNNEIPNEEVWFSRIGDTMMTLERDRDFDGCALSIGSRGTLTTFTNAAPLITASVLVIEENRQVPQDVIVSISAPRAPVTAEEGTEGVLILVSATTVSAIIIIVVIIVAVVCMCHWAKRRRKIINDDHSMHVVNNNAEQRAVPPTVYRRQTTGIQNEINAEPEVLRIALIPYGHNRAQQGNGSREIVSTRREGRSTATPSEANLQRIRNEPIEMERNESYGKLETTTDCDADYYFMYDYPNVY